MSVSSAAELATVLEQQILEGRLLPGSRLEPVRVAAASLGLAPNTVAAAYRTLAERGLVQGHGRRGTFVEDRPAPASQLIPEVPPGLVDLATGRPDPSLLPDLHPFLTGLGGSTATYGDPSLDPELQAAAAAHLGVEGIPCDHMAATGGAVDGVERVLATSLRPGDAVAVEDPGWFATVDLIRAMGLVPVPVAVDDEGIRPEALEAVAGRVSAVLMTPRAHNPTGAVISRVRADLLSGVLKRHPGVLIIEDDHMGPVGGGKLSTVGHRLERWAYIRSFAKSLGPDLRVAVVTGDAATVDRLETRQLLGPGWVSHILQRVTARLLESSEVATAMGRAAAAYEQRRRVLALELTKRGIEVASGSGLNVWVPVADEEAAVRSAFDAGLAIRSGRRFRHHAPPGVRVTISQIEPNHAEELAEALTSRPTAGRWRAV